MRRAPHALLSALPALAVAGLLLAGARAAPAPEKDPTKITTGAPELVEVHKSDDLDAPTSVVVSPDGKFLYASAWKSASHVVFKRDPRTGRLERVQTVRDATLLDGATDLRLSKDGGLAAAAAFRSRSVVLYRRDPDKGELTLLDSKRSTDNGVSGMDFPIGVQFSPDGRFVYVLDSQGALTAFRVTGKGEKGRLEFVEANQNADLKGVRGLDIHPNGTTLFASCCQAHTLVVLTRDKATGRTQVKQVLRDGAGGVEGLGGAFGVAVSPDGKFVYTTSGRFSGDDAVGVFRFGAKEGTLSVVQEIIRGQAEKGKEDPLADFEGGNEITVSPDGKNVYAVATRSGALAAFARDAATGRLKPLKVVKGDAVAGGAGVTVSPDWRFVYVAAENNGAVSCFRRK